MKTTIKSKIKAIKKATITKSPKIISTGTSFTKTSAKKKTPTKTSTSTKKASVSTPSTTTKKSSSPTIETKKMPAWEVMLNVMSPIINRPRRTSIHTIAAVCGYKNITKLAAEMKKSGKVLGYKCPDVSAYIFYLKSLKNHPGMINTPSARVWDNLPAFFAKHPFPAVKGFKRFASGSWSGGSYGVGKYVAGSSDMAVPYEPADYAYANVVIAALKKAGFTPGIKPFKIKSKSTTTSFGSFNLGA